MYFSYQTRTEHLHKMTDTQLDILVIGGGITGAGIALDGITRGLGVGLVEMGDFANGTSSHSSKLVEGGLRFLRQGQLIKFKEIAQESYRLHENAPHLTTPFKMMHPFYQTNPVNPISARLSLNLYDRVAKVKGNQQSDVLNKQASLKREPTLHSKYLAGSGIYLEYRGDDSRLTMEVLKRAAEFGAYLVNYTKVEKFLYSQATGKMIGVRVRDLVTGQEKAIYARRIINASGISVDSLRTLDSASATKELTLTKGIHLVFDRKNLPLNNSLYLASPFNDGLMIFAILRNSKVYVGTSQIPYYGSVTEVKVDQSEIDYLLNAINLLFSLEPITANEIESAWAGLRPLSLAKPTGQDQLIKSETGLYSIIASQLTTYRKTAEDVIDNVLKDMCREYERLFIKCRTRNLSLAGGNVGGSQGFQRYLNEFIKIGVEKFHLPHRQADLLVRRYGSNVIDLYGYLLNLPSNSQLSDLDYIMLRYALEQEMCLHPLDFLIRRSGYLLFDYHHALEIKAAVIDEMAKFYQWPASRREQLTIETDETIKKYQLNN